MAERNDIAEQIDALAVHCRPPLMSVEDRSRWTADWCEDLKEFPIEAIANACRRWRQGTNTKFPLLGQLLPLVRAGNPQGADTGKLQPWRPISDAEFNALPLRAKIRHHQILAHEARNTGGPMWTEGQNGRALTIDQMPAKWHDAQRRAKNHDAEARRLREFMKSPQAQAQQQGGHA